MKTNLYVITDTKANRTTEPFSCPTDAVAKRNFIFGCLSAQTPPQDSVLMRIATFSVDDENPSCFGFLNTDVAVINPTVEEIEGYAKLHRMLFSEDGSQLDEAAFKEFMSKGVI